MGKIPGLKNNQMYQICDDCGDSFIRSKFQPYIIQCKKCRKTNGTKIVKGNDKKSMRKPFKIIDDDANNIRLTESDINKINDWYNSGTFFRLELKNNIFRRVGEHIGINMALYDNNLELVKVYNGKI